MAALVLLPGVAMSQATKMTPAAPEQETPALQPAPTNQPPATGPAGPTGGDGQQSKGFGDMLPLILIIGAFVIFYWWMGRGRRKEEAKRKDMLANLKKGDRVTTIGGIRGNVIEVREDEVLVKVDESTRMRFSRWAIRDVGEEKPADDQKK
jgi:preprotein translocase subunit YajC